MSAVLKFLCQLLQVQKLNTTPYHPQGNGIAEAFMKVLGNQLAMLVNDKHADWPGYIPQLLFSYRATPHPATGESPFFLMHGYDPVWPIDLIIQKQATTRFSEFNSADPGDYQTHTQELQEARSKAWQKLSVKFPKFADPDCSVEKKTKIPSFSKNQLVLLKMSEIEKKKYPSAKFAPKWTGPFRIVKQDENKVSYEIKNIVNGKARKAHVSQLQALQKISSKEFIKSVTTFVSVQKAIMQ